MLIKKEEIKSLKEYNEYKKKIISCFHFLKTSLLKSSNKPMKDIMEILKIDYNNINNYENAFTFINYYIRLKKTNKEVIKYLETNLYKINEYNLNKKDKLIILFTFIYFYLKDLEKYKKDVNNGYYTKATEDFLVYFLPFLQESITIYNLIIKDYYKNNNMNITVYLENFYLDTFYLGLKYKKTNKISDKALNYIINNFIKIYLLQNEIIKKRIEEKNINNQMLIDFISNTYSKDFIIKLFIYKNLSNFLKLERMLDFLTKKSLRNFFFYYYNINKEDKIIFRRLKIKFKLVGLNISINKLLNIVKEYKKELKQYFILNKINPNIKYLRIKIANNFVNYFYNGAK